MNKSSSKNNLAKHLGKPGGPVDVDELMDLIAGVAAAPPAANPSAWMGLVSPQISPEFQGHLTDELSACRQHLETTATTPLPHERLEGLRNQLAYLQVDGFVVPRGDEHQGEYVALKSERLHWLTGFSGSAGTAIILAKKAAVFVDGRYTLQAESEIDGALFETCHLTNMPPGEWISANLPDGAKLAYDPWLHTPGQVSRLEAACQNAGGELIALKSNPVDHVWLTQPPPPISPVRHLEDIFSGLPSSEKRQKLADGLDTQDTDALILSAPDSIAWLLNIRGGDIPFTPFALSFAILHRDASIDWFIDPRKLMTGLAGTLGPDVRIQSPEKLKGALERLASRRKSVELNTATIPMQIYKCLKDGGAQIKRGDDPCQLAKACKNPVELNGMRSAHRRDGAAVCQFLFWLSSQACDGKLTELSAGDHLESLRQENEYFQGLSFPTISGAGPNGAIVHYRVTEETNKALEPGTLFLVDSGGQYLDGTTDITRTIAIGAPSDDMRDNFTRVLKGHIALASVRFPKGTAGSQLDILARHPLWQAGLDYDHGTGHGVGSYLSVHEGPQRISKIPNTVALKPGMIISNEPGYYKAGAYGIRIENLVSVVLSEHQKNTDLEMLEFETLTLAPIDRDLINPELMSPEEISWLDSYHLRVWKIISPLVDAQAALWLKSATAPLR